MCATIDEIVAWYRGPFGQRFVAQDGYVLVARPAFDANNSGDVDIGDIVATGNHFGMQWTWHAQGD
jgi:hypothetical protein